MHLLCRSGAVDPAVERANCRCLCRAGLKVDLGVQQVAKRRFQFLQHLREHRLSAVAGVEVRGAVLDAHDVAPVHSDTSSKAWLAALAAAEGMGLP